MLKEAVTAGQLSIIDYYTEADNVYRNLQAYMELENQYQKLMASITKIGCKVANNLFSESCYW